jgi:hypothetical protein
MLLNAKPPADLQQSGAKRPVLPINIDTSGAEFTFFETNLAVFLRAVLRKECVGIKSDTLLATNERPAEAGLSDTSHRGAMARRCITQPGTLPNTPSHCASGAPLHSPLRQPSQRRAIRYFFSSAGGTMIVVPPPGFPGSPLSPF